ncbi:MAG TPA: RsmB/NOP family class I SAM-dependent RNA methyltransferase [Xanthobacteraceae bacterium]|nr:RsmB/NOP family class I SAM-dependent RNA methyltransferase [Xanthobacteraceae bacterium]
MTPAARLSAAIEVIADIDARRRPAADALKDWGLAHRFAGSADRAAIAGLVYDTLRRKSSSAWLMGEAGPRAVLVGMLHRERGLDVAEIAALCSGARFAPAPLSEAERAALAGDALASAPAPVLGDYPDWLDAHLSRVFKDERAAEGAALASRAPLDMRVNTLKIEREEVLPMVAHLHAEPTRWSPIGLRIRLSADAKSPAIHAEPCFRKGSVEIQDEGSQLAALFAGAKPGEQVVDLAAGAGGKTLALAAVMENRGQIYATDIDKRRLAPIHERIARAGARNIQVRTPRGETDVLADLAGRIDVVLIDAPCTGTGAWRRNPDAKWRVRPGALAERVKQQEVLLDRAAALVKAGGRIAYVTCSVLQEENADQVRGFLSRHPDFTVVSPREIVAAALGERAMLFCRAALVAEEGLLMTPRATDTDGFYVAVMRKA